MADAVLRAKLPCHSALAYSTAPLGGGGPEGALEGLCGGQLASSRDISVIGRWPAHRLHPELHRLHQDACTWTAVALLPLAAR
eukprot:15463178-Alexandrium_andersonii.AAC.1